MRQIVPEIHYRTVTGFAGCFGVGALNSSKGYLGSLPSSAWDTFLLMKVLLYLSLSLVLVSCSITAELYPQSGPLAQINPLPILKAQVNGVLGNSGTITLTMPDGENCKGRWASVAPRAVGTVSGSVGLSMLSGSYSGIKPGQNRGEAFLAGDRGTRLEVVFYTGSGTASGYGEAADNRGNKYKVLF